jgi:hypothetical protein
MGQFAELRSLSREEKTAIHRDLRRQLLRVNNRDVIAFYYEYLLLEVSLWLGGATIVGVPFLVYALLPTDAVGVDWLVIVLLYIAAALALLLFASLPERLFPIRKRLIIGWRLFVVIILGTVVGETFGEHTTTFTKSIYSFGLLAASVTTLVVIIGISIANLISGTIYFFIDRTKAFRCPEAWVCENFLRALHRLERIDRKSSQLGERRETMFFLERASSIIEHHLPRRLASGDAETDKKIQQRFLAIAGALRNSKLVLFGWRRGDLDALSRKVAAALLFAVTGRYSELPVTATATATPRPGRRDRMRNGGHLLLRAFLPGAVVVALALAPIGISQTIIRYGSVIAGLWALLTVLGSLDPLYGEKVNTILGLGPFFGLPDKAQRERLEGRATGKGD